MNSLLLILVVCALSACSWNEQELDSEVRPAHRPHDLGREFVPGIEPEQLGLRQPRLRELLDGSQCHFEGFFVQPFVHVITPFVRLLPRPQLGMANYMDFRLGGNGKYTPSVFNPRTRHAD